MADRGTYQGRLRERARTGFDFKWARNISITALAGIAALFLGVGTTPVKALLVTWFFATMFFVLWETGVYLRRRFVLAPFEEHQEQGQAIADLETKVASRDCVVTGLENEIAGLKTALVRKQKDQALADYLTERHAYGIRELLNKPPANFLEAAEWRVKTRDFTDGVLSKMREFGCTAQDVHGVEYIGVFAQLPLHSDFQISKDLSMLVERLNRIGAVSTKYAS